MAGGRAWEAQGARNVMRVFGTPAVFFLLIGVCIRQCRTGRSAVLQLTGGCRVVNKWDWGHGQTGNHDGERRHE